MSKYVENLVKASKKTSYQLNNISCKLKTRVLKNMAKALLKKSRYIIKENAKDLALAKKHKKTKSFTDRLTLTNKRLKEMAVSLDEIACFADPIGQVIKQWKTASGLLIKKVRVPIGVVMVVYEARPNVTSDCAGLLFKSSNVGILRGGSFSINSNKAIAKVLTTAAKKAGLKFQPFFFVEKADHKIVDQLLKQDQYIDMVIPRGGEALIKSVVEKSRIAVIKHYKGVCHIFVDESADLKKALNICLNAKVQRPGVCNAVEKILVHKNIAKSFLPKLENLLTKHRVKLIGCKKTKAILKNIKLALESDWSEEYLDLKVTIKIVNDFNQAIEHINKYGSHHTDAILSQNKAGAVKFLREVDSACTFHNLSTRFSDGYQFGLGAEIGISTDKLHARGPMGVEDLTTYKYVVVGQGQIRK